MANDRNGNVTIDQGQPQGGIGGLIFGSPDFHSVNIDPGTSSIIDRKVAQGDLSDQDIANRGLEGVADNVNIPEQNQFSSALGGYQDPAMKEALNSRAQRIYGSDLNHLQRTALAHAPEKRANNMQMGFSAVSALNQALTQANQAQLLAAQNKRAARSKIISDLFSGGGALAGNAAGKGSGATPSPADSMDSSMAAPTDAESMAAGAY